LSASIEKSSFVKNIKGKRLGKTAVANTSVPFEAAETNLDGEKIMQTIAITQKMAIKITFLFTLSQFV